MIVIHFHNEFIKFLPESVKLPLLTPRLSFVAMFKIPWMLGCKVYDLDIDSSSFVPSCVIPDG